MGFIERTYKILSADVFGYNIFRILLLNHQEPSPSPALRSYIKFICPELRISLTFINTHVKIQKQSSLRQQSYTL